MRGGRLVGGGGRRRAAPHACTAAAASHLDHVCMNEQCQTVKGKKRDAWPYRYVMLFKLRSTMRCEVLGTDVGIRTLDPRRRLQLLFCTDYSENALSAPL